MANGTQDKVQELQTKLYQAAKRSPTRRFHALFDKGHRGDFLWRAWVDVARNGGAPGVDGGSIAHIEEGGVEGVRRFWTNWPPNWKTAPTGRCRCAG